VSSHEQEFPARKTMMKNYFLDTWRKNRPTIIQGDYPEKAGPIQHMARDLDQCMGSGSCIGMGSCTAKGGCMGKSVRMEKSSYMARGNCNRRGLGGWNRRGDYNGRGFRGSNGRGGCNGIGGCVKRRCYEEWKY